MRWRTNPGLIVYCTPLSVVSRLVFRGNWDYFRMTKPKDQQEGHESDFQEQHSLTIYSPALTFLYTPTSETGARARTRYRTSSPRTPPSIGYRAYRELI